MRHVNACPRHMSKTLSTTPYRGTSDAFVIVEHAGRTYEVSWNRSVRSCGIDEVFAFTTDGVNFYASVWFVQGDEYSEFENEYFDGAHENPCAAWIQHLFNVGAIS